MNILVTPGFEIVTKHQLHHDLESVYWVLIWCILRHVTHDHPLKERACPHIFDVESEGHCRAVKVAWFVGPEAVDLAIENNEPLTNLLKRLKVLFRLHIHSDKTVNFVNAIKLYNAFADALQESGWPQDDKSKDYVEGEQLPSQPPMKTTGSSKRRHNQISH